jgi:hypothetical protein
MKKIFIALSALLLCGTAHAQWKTETYTLKGGWNAIYLHGDASYDTIDNLLPNSGTTANITEIWSWNPNPDAVQFTDSQMIPSVGTAEWSVWKRGDSASTTLSKLAGQHAYLVKCTGTASSSYSVMLKQSPQLPGNSWVRNGANLLGFPTYKNGSTFPTFSSYFATFSAAIASSSKVFKYAGGDLGATNPIQLFSTTSERVDRNQAYWFSAKVAGEYYAPLEFSLSSSGEGLNFGRSGSDIKLRIRNRTSAVVTVTLALTASEAEPSTETTVAGAVALTSRSYNAATLAWTETALGASSTQVLAPQTTIELSFGIDRTAMTGAANSFYASLLRITESSSLMDVYLPVSAYKASLAGLWVGDISLNSVSNKVSNPAHATATLTDGVVTGLTVDGSGGFGYTSAPTVTINAPAANGNTQATATAGVSGGKVTSVAAGIAGYGYSIAPAVSISAPPESIQSSGSSSMMTTSNGHKINSISVVTGGYGYATEPAVTIAAPVSVTATGVAALSGATVGSISVEGGGGWYTTEPTVTVAAPTVPVTAVAANPSIGASKISSYAVTSAGSGYTMPPLVIPGPPATQTAPLATATLSGSTVGSISTSPNVAPSYGLNGEFFLNRTTALNPAAALLAATPTSTFTQTAAINYSSMPAGTFPSQTSADSFTVLWEGWFDVTKEGTGTYTFGTGSDDGSMIFIDLNGDGDYGDAGETIVSNDGTHGPAYVIGSVNLTQSYVKIAIAYFEGSGGELMNARFKKGSYADFNLLDTLQADSRHFRTSLPAGRYGTNPTVSISAPPTAINATATVAGTLAAWTITKGAVGSGYAAVPTVTITGGSIIGTRGTATATLGLTTNSFTLNSGNVVYSVAPTVTISGGGSPTTTATATATLTDGVVTGIAIVNMGVGYTTAPTLTFSGGTVTSGVVYPTAVGNATQFGVSTITKTSNGTYNLFGAALTGATITAAPTTVQAVATAVLQYGVVNYYTITNAGSGYLTAPTVSVSGGSFFGAWPAIGRSTLSNGGVATLNYDTYGAGSGSNYVISPPVTIAAPVTGGAQSPLASVAASTGAEILNDGTLVEANHFGPTATVASLTLDSGLTFGALGASQTRFSVTGNPTLAYSTSTATASTVTDSAYKALLQNQVNSVTSYASCALTLPGLTIGRTYRIQLISDGFPGDLSVEGGSAVNYYFSGNCVSAATWTAADTIGNVSVSMGYGGTTLSLKGYALHDITTLATRTAATATAAISNGTVTGYTMTSAGSGYTSAPTVTMSGGLVTPVQATATSTVSNGVVTGFTVTNPGAGYPTVSNAGSSYVTTPAVTVAAPSPAVTATATATVSNSIVTGYTLNNAGSGYFYPPTVSLSIPNAGNQPATATATVSNGSVTSFSVTSGGGGYTVTPEVTISAPPVQTDTATPGTFALRTLLHVADDGTANLLSKVYLGQLAVAPHAYGIATQESLLQTSTRSSAHRLSAGHLPNGRVITGSGSVALGSSLACTISLPYNDPTNPFVHPFHPDHDNLDAQYEPLAEGVESYTVSRVGTFSFTSTPPSGSSVTTGWGSSVIGGTYREVITGLHSSSIQLDGTFELRRASEIGTLSQ